MTKQFSTPSDLTRIRVGKWIEQAKPINEQPTWSEKRLAIDFGGHTYIITNGQVFQCAHCGNYDPEWNATEVLAYFESLGSKSYEITVTCSVAIISKVEE